MALQTLAPELVFQVYNNLSTISDVINLSLTCQRFHSLLRSTHKLSTLFAAADREFGPIDDIIMIVTHNNTQPAYIKRSPPISYPLLGQIIAIGKTGKRFEQLYPSKRWDTDFINRRALTNHEAFRVRRALYRYWLYSEAFHNRSQTRMHRLLRDAIEERSKLLRNWSNQELAEIEDVRNILEEILTSQICPTDGTVRARMGKDTIFVQWQHAYVPDNRGRHTSSHFHHLFHDVRDDDLDICLPPPQARTTKMEGWGDEISQYHTVQSMLKLNPAQITWLHDHVVYKWQVESLIHDLGDDWFWNNGQTFSDTWSIVLHARGMDVDEIRSGIYDGKIGAAVNSDLAGIADLV
jgi:hypothetical protein